MNLVQSVEEPRWKMALHQLRRYLRLERGLSGNSVEAYLRDVSHLARYAVAIGKGPAEIGQEDLRNLLAEMNEADIALATQSRIVSGWRTFYKMLVMSDEVKENPAELVEMPRTSRHLPDVLSDDEIDAIIATFDLSMPDQARNRVIIEVLYGCGLRVSELVELKLSNLFLEDGFIKVEGKGSKQRLVPISEQAIHE